MATTSGKDLVRYRKSKKRPARRDSVKPIDAAKRWAFPIVLLAAVIITWIVLFATGMASGAFGAATYALTLTLVVTVFHAVILAYPTFLAIKKKAWWRLIVVGVMLLGMLIALVIGYIHLASIPLWGLKIPGVLALLLSAIAAYLLARYAEEDQNLVEDLKLLPARDKAIRKQQQVVDTAGFSAQHAEKVARDLATESANITHAAEQASNERTAKQKAYDNSSAVKAVADMEKEIGAKQAEVDDLEAERALISRSMSKSSDETSSAKSKAVASTEVPRTFEGKRERLEEIKALLKDLRQAISQLQEKQEKAKQDAEASSEKRQLDAAKAYSVQKSKEEKAKRKERDAAKEEANRETRAFKLEQSKLDGMTGQRNEVTSRQQNAEETRRLMWRDDLLAPGLCALFALLFYPAWYGWVVLEVF